RRHTRSKRDWSSDVCSSDLQKAQRSLEELKNHLKKGVPARHFEKALHRRGKLALIAELKQASPSAGLIRQEPDISGRIRAYTREIGRASWRERGEVAWWGTR